MKESENDRIIGLLYCLSYSLLPTERLQKCESGIFS